MLNDHLETNNNFNYYTLGTSLKNVSEVKTVNIV